MKITFLREMVGFVVLVLLQTLVLNRISVFGVAVPILYIYFLIKLPKNRNLFYVVISGFLMGLIIDIFLNTPGMNAAATTIVATLRKPLMNIFFSKVEYEDFVPSIYTETGAFLRYSVVMVLLHQTLLFFIESFTFFNLTSTLIRIGASSVLTLILIIALDGLMYRKTSGV
ncbi:MAG: rod shape-determining protein MreD [Dysgonamonadaceae bacterium]|jgi:rod shape-determining protein MreD|nr:rod shape-determining protein MreD [Bacteroidales bacterium]